MNRQRFTQRFLSRIDRAPCVLTYLGDCWLWRGARCGPNGAYGQSFLDGRRQMAHRVAWKLFVGPLDDDDDLDHLCLVPCCVNPAHCQPVSHRKNIQRGYELKTRCPAGHLYTAANIAITPSGARRCRACNREQQRTWEQAHPGYNAACCRRYQERKRKERTTNRTTEY